MPNNLVTFFLSFVFLNVFVAQANSQGPTIPKDFILVTNSQDFGTTKSIQQHGITWTFAKPVIYGQFVNGDYWVVDPGDGVEVIDISPGHTLHPDTGRHMNGSMLNHRSQSSYDSFSSYYDKALNVGIGVSSSTPLNLKGDVSLISTISNLAPSVKHLSYVNTVAVLTCLSSAPPHGSFRPGISTKTKTIHNASSINYTLLKKLASPITKPDIAPFAKNLQMAWLSGTERYLRPSASGLDNYYFPITFAEIALLLHLDYSIKEKQDLVINFLQLGIDLYSHLEAGSGGWSPDGGRANGRKWPILFAGIMLDYAPMKNIGQVSGDYLYSDGHGPGNLPPDYKQFGEDAQTFYVAQSDVNATSQPLNCLNIKGAESCNYATEWCPDCRNTNYAPYTYAHIGMPEWGIRYSSFQSRSDASWTAMYRTIGTGPSTWAGIVIAANIMNAKALWNHDVLFDYVDRYMAISQGLPDPFGYKAPNEKAGGGPGGLIGAMWDTYGGRY